jgi:hypothetical protein
MHLKTLGIQEHDAEKQWEVMFHDDFVPEYRESPEAVQNAMIASRFRALKSAPISTFPLCGVTWKGWAAN